MENDASSLNRQDEGVIDIAFVLLLLQGAMGLVSTLGVLALGLVTGAIVVLGLDVLLGLSTAGALLVMAAGIARRRRWVWRCAFVYEGLVLAGSIVNLALHLFTARAVPGLMPVLTGWLLPGLVVGLLMHPVARAAFSRRKYHVTPVTVWIADHPVPAVITASARRTA